MTDLCYHRHRTASMELAGTMVMTPYYIRCDDCGATVHWGIYNTAPDMPPMPYDLTEPEKLNMDKPDDLRKDSCICYIRGIADLTCPVHGVDGTDPGDTCFNEGFE